jgi:hypothetical protein
MQLLKLHLENAVRDQTTFSLPIIRGEQLRSIAKHHRLDVSELLGRWIDHGLTEAGLNFCLPGVEITVCDTPKMTVQVGGLALALQSAQDASDVADALEHVARFGGTRGLLSGSEILTITRRGDGVIVDIGGARKSFSPDLARALARQIRNAIQ